MRFLSFIEGNPGVPGDGVIVQDSGTVPFFDIEQLVNAERILNYEKRLTKLQKKTVAHRSEAGKLGPKPSACADLALGNIFKFFFPDSWYIMGLGFVLGLAVVFFVGTFLESQAFRRRFHNVEQLVIKIPVVKPIYTAMRDFTSLFGREQKGKF